MHKYFRQAYTNVKSLNNYILRPVFPKPAYSHKRYKGAYYASIILTKKLCVLCSKLCQHNLPIPTSSA